MTYGYDVACVVQVQPITNDRHSHQENDYLSTKSACYENNEDLVEQASPQKSSETHSNDSQSVIQIPTILQPPTVSIHKIIPCVMCGNDSIMRCKRCKRCYYCSLACRDLHYPFHASACQHSREDQYSETQAMLGETDILPSYSRTELIREGIVNSGNTCFLASSLQCLYSVAPLRHLLMSNQYQRYMNSAVYDRELSMMMIIINNNQ